MADFRGRGRGVVRAPRRQTAWDIGVETGTNGSIQGISGAATTIWLGGIVPVVEGLTIVRIRGFIELRMSLVTAVGDGFNGAMGIIPVDDRAFAAGAGSIPRPFSDESDEGWMWHRYFSIHPESTTLESNASYSMQIEIDTKAMRKFPQGHTLVGVIQTVNETGTAVLDIYAASRTLVKLP